MISQKTISEIFDIIQIDEVISDFLPLKKRGANMLGNCPFHDEKTPSFTVSPTKGIYKCFGCGRAGNAVNFVMEHEQVSYPQALRYLAQKYQIEIEEDASTIENKEAINQRESLFIINQYAQKYFNDNLFHSEEGKNIGLTYFYERGFTKETIEKFQLGYCLDKWTAFTDTAKSQGYKLDYLSKLGLTKVREGGKYFDFYKGRVIFPIHNISGKVIGFGGRTLKTDKKVAKYFNSPESDIYHKSKVLYGIYQSKKAISTKDNCYLVEGYTDVISLYQAGIENVVASSGTSLTKDQIKLISRYTKNITVLFDGDAAGIKASFRSIDLILEADLNVKAVSFPEGEDPDSYAKNKSSTELYNYLESQSKDFIVFKSTFLLNEINNDPLKKANLIGGIVNSIALIPNAIKRSLYIKETANQFDLDEQVIQNETNKALRKNRRQNNKNTPAVEPQEDFIPVEVKKRKEIDVTDTYSQEEDIIRLLLNYGSDNLKLINEEEEDIEISVVNYIIQLLLEDNIVLKTASFQKIFELYQNALNEGYIPSIDFFYTHPDHEIVSTATNLTTTQYEISPNWKRYNIYTNEERDRLILAVEKSVYSVKLKKINELINNLDQKIKNESEDFETLLKEKIDLHQIKSKIQNHIGR